ncbi:hypothetical protein KFL_008700040 [Klebsormidium nitens]|uniref:N-acetyltransferase domain-containing protein n=1 Tax=Klebsormidium nitens TaxID=105231 RepID=A0A1Y1IQW5_KLENI|nr:hypothetical protein KFL_008700040 [Klebsormidium nitens]|eukprot:GAQ91859.1 hypothetical protein KFL_008700040 [Klebsormidium nitens]
MAVCFQVPLPPPYLHHTGTAWLAPHCRGLGPALESPLAAGPPCPGRPCRRPADQPPARHGARRSCRPQQPLAVAPSWGSLWPLLGHGWPLDPPQVQRRAASLCSCSARDAPKVEPQRGSNGGALEGESRVPPEALWPAVSPAQLVAGYRREVAHQGGRLVIQPLDAEHYEAAVGLLAESFADSIDAASLVGYIRTQIVRYLAEQERFFAKGQGVCLAALWYPPPASSGDPPLAQAVLVGTVSLAFAVRSLPRFPTLNVPPHRSSAYLSNMAVQPSHRRRGVARQLLVASEELAAALGKRALYLHVRFVDSVPQHVYAGVGYCVVARDTPLSWLFLQRRRSLMRKQLAPLAAGPGQGLQARESAVS